AEERRVSRVLGQQPVRSAVAEGEDRLGSPAIADCRHPLGDMVERLVPAHPRERPLPLAAAADRRIEETILAVDAAREAADLRTDELARGGIRVAAVDLDDAAL